MKHICAVFALFFASASILYSAEPSHHETQFDRKPTPAAILSELQNGNTRFVEGKPAHPHSTPDRRLLAAEKSQGDYATATVLCCSDSRVPPELIFDSGIMDLFVVRVPGNICQKDEIGGIEYGIHHVYTPAVVVLGHSDCGAVTAAVKGGHKLERNIPELLKPIYEVVRDMRQKHPQLDEKQLLALCIRENVYHEIKQLFERSAATRNIVKSGKVAVIGGIYDLNSGKIEWLDRNRITKILAEVEANESHETKEFAD